MTNPHTMIEPTGRSYSMHNNACALRWSIIRPKLIHLRTRFLLVLVPVLASIPVTFCTYMYCTLYTVLDVFTILNPIPAENPVRLVG